MHAVRISPVEVQVGVMVYKFLNADLADGFLARAVDGDDAVLIESKELALRSRPVDCDHELGRCCD